MAASPSTNMHKIPAKITISRAPIPFDEGRSSGADIFLRLNEESL